MTRWVAAQGAWTTITSAEQIWDNNRTSVECWFCVTQQHLPHSICGLAQLLPVIQEPICFVFCLPAFCVDPFPQVNLGGETHSLEPLSAASEAVHVFTRPTLFRKALWLPYR
jgi:hypothetical protein